MNTSRESLLPVDIDWTMQLVDDISKFLYHKKKDIDEASSVFMSLDILSIVDKHLSQNGYRLTNTTCP